MSSKNDRRVLLSRVVELLKRKGVKYSNKDLEELTNENDSDTQELEAAICRARMSKGYIHNRITNDPALTKCKPLVDDFMQEFELSLKDACEAIAWLALEIMERKFQINKIPFYHQKILQAYEYNLVVNNDSDTKLTSQIFTAYCMLCKYVSGSYVKELEKPSNYFHFVYAAEECHQYKAEPMAWVKTQFEAFKSMSIDLEPYHLYGPKARQRYLKTEKTPIVRTRRDRTALRYADTDQ